MQGSIFEPSDISRLADPDPLSHALFESPMLPALGLLALAVLVGFTLRSTGQRRTGLLVVLFGVLASAGVFVSAALVLTDREVLQSKTRGLVTAVADGSSSVLDDMLDQDVLVSTRFVSAQGRERVLDLAVSRAAPYVDEHEVHEVQAELLGPRIARTHARIRTKGASLPTLSWWRVDWVREDSESDEWRATHIEPLWIQGFDRVGG